MLRNDDNLGIYHYGLLTLACLTAGIVVIGDSLVWHPGYGDVDEIAVVRVGWEMFHGMPLAPVFGTGYFNSMAVGLSQHLSSPGWMALHLPCWLIFFLENALLWRFSRRHFGILGAWGALLANLISAFSFGRARGILSMGVLPCELLMVLELAALENTPAQLMAGFLCGLFSLEYEAWIYSCWPLALAGMIAAKKSRALALGFFAAIIPILYLNRDAFESYWLRRAQFTLMAAGGLKKVWGQSLLGLVWGGESYPGLGSAWRHPSLAPWAMPFIAMGIARAWRDCKWLLAWAAWPLLLLIPPSAGLNESQRAIAAWPAFAMLAGLGLSVLLKRKATLWIALWLLAGFAWECQAFLKSQEHFSASYYGPSRAREAAASWLKARGGRLLSNLGERRASEFEWACSPLSAGDSMSVAFLRWEQLPALGKDPRGLHLFKDPLGNEAVYLLEPDAAWEPRLAAAESSLAPFWASVPNFQYFRILELCEKALAAPTLKNPWVRTSIWQRRMQSAASTGKVDKALMAALRREPLLHAGPLYHPSFMVGRFNLELGAELHAQALKLDPRLEIYEGKKE